VDTDALGLSGKAVAVLGAGSGIGRATAPLLARAGAHVAVGDVDADAATRVAGEAEALGAKVVVVTGSVLERDSAEQIVADAVAGLGGLDGLVNIVGAASWKDVMSIDDDTWALDIQMNLTHHLFVSRAAARHMIEADKGGSIAVVASVSGIYGAPNHGTYGAAKAGLMGLVRTMAVEWGPYGIRVNAVAPDSIGTPRVRGAFTARGLDMDEVVKRDRAPLARAGTPEEIAGPLTFLISDLSSYVSGQTIIVDGGMRAVWPHGDPVMKND
jgi:NAD(P)-dependent dehydrogenase (short-subunit alcohol dehydrogenase family)